MKQELLQVEWLGLDQELRDKLKEVFSINRSEGMKVVSNKLVSDGCSQNDLTVGITIGKMIDYLNDTSFGMNTDNSEKLFDDLFERVVNKAKQLNDVTVEFDNVNITNGIVTGELNSNIKEDEKTNKGTKSESKGTPIESKGDKQTTGDGDNRPSGDDSVNASSGDREDIQRPKAKDKSKRTGNSSGKGTGKGKKAC